MKFIQSIKTLQKKLHQLKFLNRVPKKKKKFQVFFKPSILFITSISFAYFHFQFTFSFLHFSYSITLGSPHIFFFRFYIHRNKNFPPQFILYCPIKAQPYYITIYDKRFFFFILSSVHFFLYIQIAHKQRCGKGRTLETQ